MALSELGLRPLGAFFTDRSIASLSSGQAAGTSSIIGANANRTALKIVPPVDCTLLISSSVATGIPLFGGVSNDLSGSDCPTNTLYLRGLTTGAAVSIWEA